MKLHCSWPQFLTFCLSSCSLFSYIPLRYLIGQINIPLVGKVQVAHLKDHSWAKGEVTVSQERGGNQKILQIVTVKVRSIKCNPWGMRGWKHQLVRYWQKTQLLQITAQSHWSQYSGIKSNTYPSVNSLHQTPLNSGNLTSKETTTELFGTAHVKQLLFYATAIISTIYKKKNPSQALLPYV